MTTKSNLFTTVSAILLLLLVVPALNEPSMLPTYIATIAALSVISIAAGGFAAETYDIVKRKSVPEVSGIKAKKYFMYLTTSLLFLAIVAPSIQPEVEEWGVAVVATVVTLLILSVAVAGLTAEGLFAIFSLAMRPTRTSPENGPKLAVTRSQSNQEEQNQENIDIASHIDSSFKAFDATQERRMQELQQQLIHEFGRKHDLGRANVDFESKPASNGTSQVKSQLGVQGSLQDHVLDALLGKDGKAGGK